MKKISLSEVEVNELLDLYQSEIDRAQRRITNLKTIIKKLSEEKSIEVNEEKPEKPEKNKSKKERKTKTKAPLAVSKKTEEVKEIVKEPKKRGRKKKEVKTEAKVEVKQDKKKEVAIPKPAPKVRGRKKKITIAAPKKRGRKPKSLRKPIKGGRGKDKVKWNDFILETITSKNSLMLASSLTQAALEKFQIPNSDRDRVRMAISTTLTKMANKDKVLKTHSEKGLRGAFFGLKTWFNDKGNLNNEYKKKLM